MAIIYKIQNKTNGKVYIGQTRKSLEWRLNNSWCGHFTRAFEQNKNNAGALYNALRKYGKDGFTYEILEEKDNDKFVSDESLQQWLNTKEEFWIAQYDSFAHGYNRTLGGDSCKGNTNVKGRIHVYKENEDYRMIRPEELEEFLAMGYIKGTGRSHHNYLTNEQKVHRVQKMKERGTFELLRDVSAATQANKGCRHLYKDGVKKLFKKEDVEQAFNTGWMTHYDYVVSGGQVFKRGTKELVKYHKPKFKLLYKNGKQRRVKPEELEQAQKDGWLPYKEYLAKGGELSWRFSKRRHED